MYLHLIGPLWKCWNPHLSDSCFQHVSRGTADINAQKIMFNPYMVNSEQLKLVKTHNDIPHVYLFY